MVSARREKVFCTLKCFLKSPRFREGIKNRKRRADVVDVPCPGCGVFMRGKGPNLRGRLRYCSAMCRRRHWASVFDRMIASPELIPLPQNYDEFLTKDRLPCLFPGCEWQGKSLANHVMNYHGVPAEKFKELAGFNRGTGLICPELAEVKSAQNRGKKLSDDDRKLKADVLRSVCAAPKPKLRREGREHFSKSHAGKKHSKESREKMAAAARERERCKRLSGSK